MKKLKLLLPFLPLFITFQVSAAPMLKAFETDNCTMFLDGPVSQPKLWQHCCIEHDLRYWFGGGVTDMDNTDLRLKGCVQKAAGEQWARLIYSGVRAGHYSPIKNKYYWGWAWSPNRLKNPLTTDEVIYVKSLLQTMKVEGVNMEEFMKANFP